MSRRGVEGVDQAVDILRADTRHVAKRDNRAGAIIGQGGETGFQRRAQPVGVVRVPDEGHVEPRQHVFDGFRRVSEDNHNRRRTAGEQGAGSMKHHRCAVDFDQHLVGGPHATRLACCQQQSAHCLFVVVRHNGHIFVFAGHRAARHFLQQSSDAHACEILRSDGKPGDKPLEHPVETMKTRRPRRSRDSQHPHIAEPRKQHQVAGIDRQAEMVDRTPGFDHRGWHDIAPVDDGGRAKNQRDVATGIGKSLQSVPDGRNVMGAMALGIDGEAHLGEPAGRGRSRLGDDAVFQPGKNRLNKADPEAGIKGRHANRGGAGPGDYCAVFDSIRRNAEGDHLHRRRHLTRGDRLERPDGGDRQRFVDTVHAVDGFGVDQRDAVGIGPQIGATGATAGGRQPVRFERFRQSEGSLVFIEIAVFEPGDSHRFKSGLPQAGDVRGVEDPALAQDAVGQPHGVREDRADGRVQSDFPEFHNASAG